MTAVWVENPYAGQGPVLLDLGADSEVGQGHHHVGFGHGDHPGPDHPQIHPHGSTGHPPHVAVLRRPVPSGRLVASAVFPDLRPGRYRLWVLPAGSPRTVDLEPGQVTCIDWALS